MTTIKLPPLPTLPWLGYDPERGNMHGLNHGELRARDLEAARVVRDRIADIMDAGGYRSQITAISIRKLEFTHEQK